MHFTAFTTKKCFYSMCVHLLKQILNMNQCKYKYIFWDFKGNQPAGNKFQATRSNEHNDKSKLLPTSPT